MVPVNSTPAGAPTIDGNAQVGQRLTASTTGISDPDGLSDASYTYQWISNDGTNDSEIQEATENSYTLTAAQQDMTVKVKVSFTDDNRNKESLTSEPTDAVAAANGAPTGTPDIMGKTVVGQTLTADTSGITDPDGLQNASFAYQWRANDGTADNHIPGATGSTYVLTAGEQSKTINVEVAFTDDNGNYERMISGPTSTVATQLTAAAHDTPASHNGTDAFTFELRFNQEVVGLSYLTLRDDAFTVTNGNVEKARRLQRGSNIGWEITIQPSGNGDVTAILPVTTDCNTTGAICTNGNNMLSSGLEINIPGPASEPTGQPTISGIAQVGQTLMVSTSSIADNDGLTNVSFTYQWAAGDSDIPGATGTTYTPIVVDVGKAVKVKVTFTDDAQNTATLTSAGTAAVTATVPDAPGGLTVEINDTGTLDLSWNAPGSNGGAVVTGYKIQWKESTDSWDIPADVSETTATRTSHAVSGLTDGTTYTFRVMATNSAGDSAPSTENSGTPRETTAPSVSSASVNESVLTITFSENLAEPQLPATSTFAVTVGGNNRSVSTVAISGSVVTLTLASAVSSHDQVTVGYTAPTNEATAGLQDANGNYTASFSGQNVTNNTPAPPLTASVRNVAASHDGSNEFTLELHFSENLSISYKTLRDSAFTVTNGNVEKARRLQRGSNIGWEITIQPSGNGEVTAILPVTTDCNTTGAICTSDGRKLSNQAEATVSGPGS